MSIKYSSVEKDGFNANIATIYCDLSGLKMFEVIIRESERVNTVEAEWEGSNGQVSGKHEIIGSLYCIPIETVSQKTAIIKISTDKKDNILINRLVIKKIK